VEFSFLTATTIHVGYSLATFHLTENSCLWQLKLTQNHFYFIPF
jgi:hypothetical protein